LPKKELAMRTNPCRAFLILGTLLVLSEHANAAWTVVSPALDARLWSLAMQADGRAIEQCTSDFSAELTRHFEDLAWEAGVEIDILQVRGLWQQGFFAAAVGAQSSPSIEGVETLGLVRLSTPRGQAMGALGDREVPPGDYSILLYPDGSVHLQQIGGDGTVPISPPGTVALAPGGKLPPCSTGWRIETTFRGCEICYTAVCPGIGVVLLGCVNLCDAVHDLSDGLFDW
jgi:hypothetical protein